MAVPRTILQAPVVVARLENAAADAPPQVLPREARGIEVGATLRGREIPRAARELSIVHFGSSSMQNAQGKPRWRGPGDTMRFEMTVRVSGDAKKLPYVPAVYTNANFNDDPKKWRAHPMRFESQQGDRASFVLDLPVWRLGNYSATGVVLDGKRPVLWAGKCGIGDVAFRPYAIEHDQMLWNLVNVMNLGTPGQVGSFEDMRGEGSPETNGRYTLRAMKADGVQSVRLLPTQPRRDGPYSKTAMFEVWAEYSKPARAIRGEIEALKKKPPSAERDDQILALEGRMYRAALASLQAMIVEAQALGIHTILDIVPNHVGRDLAVQDAFFVDDKGEIIDLFDPTKTAARLEVRRNDGRQIAVDDAQAQRIQARIDGGAPGLQDAAPHLFGKWLDPHGARNKQEIAHGGWGEWRKPGTWQMNNGTFRTDYTWFERDQTEETRRTRAYILREMAFWILLGVDGFRIDHGTGLPWVFYQEDLNLLQSVADRYRPGLKVYIETEDFHTQAKTRPFSDTVEQSAFRPLIRANGADQLRAAFDAPWRQVSSNDAGNHDQESAIHMFGGDHRAYARFLALEALLGGPNGRKMGDEYGEMGGLDFRGQGTKLWTLSRSNEVTKAVHQIVSRAGRAKQDLPALHHRTRIWMENFAGGWPKDLLVAARLDEVPPGERGSIAVVAANLHGSKRRGALLAIPAQCAGRLDDRTYYMAFDHMARTPERWLWAGPKTGAEIKEKGLYVELGPYQVQAIDLAPMRRDDRGRWEKADAKAQEPRRPIPPAVRVIV